MFSDQCIAHNIALDVAASCKMIKLELLATSVQQQTHAAPRSGVYIDVSSLKAEGQIHVHSFNQHDSLDGLYVFHGTALNAEVICHAISAALPLDTFTYHIRFRCLEPSSLKASEDVTGKHISLSVAMSDAEPG
jgi:hypothetical protein